MPPPQTLESNNATFPLPPPPNHNDSKFEEMEQEITRLINTIDEKDNKIKAITETKEKVLETLQTSSDQKTLQFPKKNLQISQNNSNLLRTNLKSLIKKYNLQKTS